MSDRKTVAGAYAALGAHESECAVRYTEINNTLGRLEKGQEKHERAAWSLVLAILGFLAVQAYNAHSAAPQRSPSVASAAP